MDFFCNQKCLILVDSRTLETIDYMRRFDVEITHKIIVLSIQQTHTNFFLLQIYFLMFHRVHTHSVLNFLEIK